MNEVLKTLSSHKIIPVVVLNSTEDAVPLMKALIEGGLPVAEVTFRTEAALESIRLISSAFPDAVLGAGSVSTVEQVISAVDAGAKYIVSAGFSKKVVDYCVENEIPVLPGTCTPTEIMMALEAGLDTVKFFPAEQYGGLNTIKALSAPFHGVRFVPTGGINKSNIAEYLAFDKIIACGGSWMVKDTLISNKEFDKIAELTAEAVNMLKSV